MLILINVSLVVSTTPTKQSGVFLEVDYARRPLETVARSARVIRPFQYNFVASLNPRLRLFKVIVAMGTTTKHCYNCYIVCGVC